MKIAIPVAGGKLCAHFGHCELFALVDVDETAKKILKKEELPAPPHQPGLLPGWLKQQGADMVIAGGMGMRAQEFFGQMGIKVLVGAPSDTPEKVIDAWLQDNLVIGGNICDH